MIFTLKIAKDKYKEWTKDVLVKGDMNINAKLELLKVFKKQIAKKSPDTQKTPKKGSKKWLWITGGTVVAGGVAAAVLLGGGGDDKKETPPATEFPGPPGRP